LAALSAVVACFTLSDGASFLISFVSAFLSPCFAVLAATAVPPSTRLSVTIEITSAGLGRRNLRVNIRTSSCSCRTPAGQAGRRRRRRRRLLSRLRGETAPAPLSLRRDAPG